MDRSNKACTVYVPLLTVIMPPLHIASFRVFPELKIKLTYTYKIDLLKYSLTCILIKDLVEGTLGVFIVTPADTRVMVEVHVTWAN